MMTDTSASRPGKGVGLNRPGNPRRRVIPWATVCAIRAEWAALMARLGYVDGEWMATSGRMLALQLHDEGLPAQAELAARRGVPQPKYSAIVRGRAYAAASDTRRRTPHARSDQ